MATKVNAKEQAAKIHEAAKKAGFNVSVRGNVLTVSKRFEPGDREAFVQCDMSYSGVLSLLPRTQPGSDWGTDGGGIGGHVAIKNGFFEMHRSGGNRNVLRELSR